MKPKTNAHTRKEDITMTIVELVITLGYLALVAIAFLALAYAIYALAPIVKGFVKWNINRHKDDDWRL
jgi:hypothetical protein